MCLSCGLCEEEDVTGKIVNPVLPQKLTTMTGTSFLTKFLKLGVTLILVLGSIIFIFILTSGGIKWLSSSGDKAKLESAQKQISSGFVGLVILLSAFAIIQLVQVLFGIDLLSFTLPTL
jgi:TRAP-type C4-dicarboxylate transport system permease small subunit